MLLKLTVWNRYDESGKTKDRIRLVHVNNELKNPEDLDRLVTLRNSGQDWQWEKLYKRNIKDDTN